MIILVLIEMNYDCVVLSEFKFKFIYNII